MKWLFGEPTLLVKPKSPKLRKSEQNKSKVKQETKFLLFREETWRKASMATLKREEEGLGCNLGSFYFLFFIYI